MIDIDGIYNARKQVKKAIGKVFVKDLKKLYELTNAKDSTYVFSPQVCIMLNRIFFYILRFDDLNIYFYFFIVILGTWKKKIA